MMLATTLECSVCGGSLDIPADVLLGELLDCGDCSSELEVTAIEPTVEIREAPMAAEDWGQ